MKFRDRVPEGITDRQIITMTIWGEARGAQREAQVAIGSVILNRWNLALTGRAFRRAESIGDICLWPYQFSCWNERDPNRRLILEAFDPLGRPMKGEDLLALKQISMIAEGIASRSWLDETSGADHYHSYPAGHLRWPSWAKWKEHTRTIGKFKFYRLFKEGN